MRKMKQEISIKRKKSFLKWLTKNYKFKANESLWILDYLYNHETLLNKCHFVEKVDQTPRGIYMSVVGVDTEAFKFYKNGQVYNDPVQAFHEIRFNWSSDLYLEIEFKEAWHSPNYLSVLLDNPFAPWNEEVSEKMVVSMKQALNYERLEKLKGYLLEKIDESLKNEDKEQFEKLSKQYEELEQSISELIAEIK